MILLGISFGAVTRILLVAVTGVFILSMIVEEIENIMLKFKDTELEKERTELEKEKIRKQTEEIKAERIQMRQSRKKKGRNE